MFKRKRGMELKEEMKKTHSFTHTKGFQNNNDINISKGVGFLFLFIYYSTLHATPRQREEIFVFL